ncbi:MAG TPA: hypothetical protein VHZ54_08910 [Solirubrobacterales bacterium]|jgi:hypothetical protein|nr:hypothetical protein [Solirubrobacterales bacterium]
MTPGETAADWAAAQVTLVRDDPPGRLALLSRTYRGPAGRSRRHEPFRRAAMSFMRWQAERGVLRATDGSPSGSRWWRAVNERLLLDGCEAMARSGGLPGEPSSRRIEQWMSFIAKPTPHSWYLAHNATIVSAYLENRELAELESTAERFFCNVALLRVLYAHALVAAPRLSLGRFSALGPTLGDPRLGMAGAFLSLRRVLPDHYPLDDAVEAVLLEENRLARSLDYGVIGSRVQSLYDWSAQELGIPGLRGLVRDGSPIYAWPYADRHVWRPARETVPVRLLSRATRSR